ncbi:DoxX family protein [Sphingomonas sp. ASV193]|uniref:DoxX family protein n=1 Tax=Sphingomonas sp. ASV193 TaxID=3144405 RepID=UPI0032E8C22E
MSGADVLLDKGECSRDIDAQGHVNAQGAAAKAVFSSARRWDQGRSMIMADPVGDFEQPLTESHGATGSYRPNRGAIALFALAVAALGVRGLVTGQPIPAWQPLDATPLTDALMRVDGLVLIGLAALTCLGQVGSLTRRHAAYGLCGLFAVWIALQLPPLAAKPGDIALWLGIAEVGALAAAALLLARSDAIVRHPPRDSVSTAAFAAFGLCAIIFGASHFAYADFTATMVPSWLPGRLSWAYATGLGHLAAGIAIATGVFRRTAATLLAAMMGCFILLVHIPLVVSTKGSLLQLTYLANACALCGSAWITASTAAWRSPSVAADAGDGQD